MPMKTSLLPVLVAALAVAASAQQQNPPRNDLSSVLRSGLDAFLGNQKQGQVSLQQVTANWNEHAREAARLMFEKYGAPQEVTQNRLVWHENRPWRMTAVINQQVEHNFPVAHRDVLVQSLAFDFPVERFPEVAQFDGSITVNRTAGEVTVQCDREEHNFIAVNLAHDIAAGNLNAAQARQRMAELAEAVKNGQQPSYATDIRFNLPVSNRTGDPDRPHSSRNWQRIGW